jgi:hypothetical protein
MKRVEGPVERVLILMDCSARLSLANLLRRHGNAECSRANPVMQRCIHDAYLAVGGDVATPSIRFHDISSASNGLRSCGCKSRRWNRAIAAVVISNNGECDQAVESSEVKVSSKGGKKLSRSSQR